MDKAVSIKAAFLKRVLKHSMDMYFRIVVGRLKSEVGATLASSSIEMYSTSLEPGFPFIKLRNVICAGVLVINGNEVAGLPNFVGCLMFPDYFEDCLRVRVLLTIISSKTIRPFAACFQEVTSG